MRRGDATLGALILSSPPGPETVAAAAKMSMYLPPAMAMIPATKQRARALAKSSRHQAPQVGVTVARSTSQKEVQRGWGLLRVNWSRPRELIKKIAMQ